MEPIETPDNPPEAEIRPPVPAGAALSPPESPEKKRANYNRLVRQAKLVSVLLEKLDFKAHPEAMGVAKSLLARDLVAKTKVMSTGTEDGTCVANIVWNISLRFKRRVVAKCEASYVIIYEGTKDFSDETVNLFVDNVGKVATYAYFRALYAHVDWSANLASPPLPILQFQPKV